jgi:threonine dehydrogenase-like Zn-dependent dehydrogenase
VKVGSIPIGGTILVTGAGSIGLQLLQLARHSGAARAIVSEPNPARRPQALRLGADLVIDPREGTLAETVRTATHGRGVAVAFETAGNPIPLADCIANVADRGTVVMVGVHPVAARLDFNLYPFHRRNLTLRGSYGVSGPDDVRAAVNWLGRIDFDSLISHRFALTDVAEAFEVARRGQAGKVMVRVIQ